MLGVAWVQAVPLKPDLPRHFYRMHTSEYSAYRWQRVELTGRPSTCVYSIDKNTDNLFLSRHRITAMLGSSDEIDKIISPPSGPYSPGRDITGSGLAWNGGCTQICISAPRKRSPAAVRCVGCELGGTRIQ